MNTSDTYTNISLVGILKDFATKFGNPTMVEVPSSQMGRFIFPRQELRDVLDTSQCLLTAFCAKVYDRPEKSPTCTSLVVSNATHSRCYELPPLDLTVLEDLLAFKHNSFYVEHCRYPESMFVDVKAWSLLIGDPAGSFLIDPVTKYELVIQGNLGTIGFVSPLELVTNAYDPADAPVYRTFDIDASTILTDEWFASRTDKEVLPGQEKITAMVSSFVKESASGIVSFFVKETANNPGVPIDPKVLEELRSVDWSALAKRIVKASGEGFDMVPVEGQGAYLYKVTFGSRELVASTPKTVPSGYLDLLSIVDELLIADGKPPTTENV